MKPRFSPPPVYFMHIPKTAGSSFRHFLQLLYPGRRTLELSAYWQFQSITLTQLRDFDCYLCHFGPALYKLVDRPELPCITILRDPVERLISTLYYRQWYVKHHPQPYTQEYLDLMVPLQDADLRTLLSTPVVADLERDAQTRNLGLDTPFDLRSWLRDGTNRDNARQIGGNPLMDLPPYSIEDMPEVSAAARQRLERMAVVMITERLGESTELACDLLGVPAPRRTPEVNVGHRKTSVRAHSYRDTTPPDLIEQVEALTIFDRELYAHACVLFKEQHARYREQPRRIYSIAPRIMMPARRGIRASSTRLQAVFPRASSFRLLGWLWSRVQRM